MPIHPHTPIHLAPMEGVLHAPLRHILTVHGRYDMAYTEFLRITNQVYKDSVFYKIYPELHTQGCTPGGTPVGLQLLGSDPQCMTDNACKAVALGATHIDINFGCPAKKVNNKGGGAELLKCSESLYKIVHTIRRGVPSHIAVSAKMRLGYNDMHMFIDNIRAITDAQPNHITIHARTKAQAYRGHADWDMVAHARPFVDCPVFINGDIVNTASAKSALNRSMADGIMVGRGALKTPNLGAVIRHHHAPYTWQQVIPLIQAYMHMIREDLDTPHFATARIKQWFAQYLRHTYPSAQVIFEKIKTLNTEKFRKALDNI